MSDTITYAVEIHEKKGEEETGYGDYIKTVGVFEKENDAWSFLYNCENYIKDDEVLGVYECYETPVSSNAELVKNLADLKAINISNNQISINNNGSESLEISFVENNENSSNFDELIKVFSEIEARYEGCNIVVPEYYNLSFVDLCNKGIDLLTQIRDE